MNEHASVTTDAEPEADDGNGTADERSQQVGLVGDEPQKGVDMSPLASQSDEKNGKLTEVEERARSGTYAIQPFLVMSTVPAGIF